MSDTIKLRQLNEEIDLLFLFIKEINDNLDIKHCNSAIV